MYDLLNYTATALPVRFNKEKGFYVQDLQVRSARIGKGASSRGRSQVFQCDDEEDFDCLVLEGHRNRKQSGSPALK